MHTHRDACIKLRSLIDAYIMAYNFDITCLSMYVRKERPGINSTEIDTQNVLQRQQKIFSLKNKENNIENLKIHVNACYFILQQQQLLVFFIEICGLVGVPNLQHNPKNIYV